MSSRPGTNGVEVPLFVDEELILHGIQEIVGRKWHPILVYRLLEEGPMGFSSLKRNVDSISSKMLSESLTELENAGVVVREQVSESPVRVRYALTERGLSLEPVIAEMVRWGSEHATDGRERPGDGEGHRGTGR